jgi:predicted transcriptional regulator
MNEVVRTEDAIDKHLTTMNQIVGEHLKGKKTQEIAKTLGMSSATVGKFLKEWRGLAANNEAMRARAVGALTTADEHYSRLIAKTYEIMEDAEQADSLSQRLAAVKMLVDIEKTRIDLLQRAGALEDADMSKQIVETERKQAILMEILKETVGPCHRCRPIVQAKLAEATKEVVVIKADEDGTY